MRVQDSRPPTFDRLDGFGQLLLQLIHRSRSTSPDLPTGSGLSNARIVRRRLEGDIQLRVRDFRP